MGFTGDNAVVPEPGTTDCEEGEEWRSGLNAEIVLPGFAGLMNAAGEGLSVVLPCARDDARECQMQC